MALVVLEVTQAIQAHQVIQVTMALVGLAVQQVIPAMQAVQVTMVLAVMRVTQVILVILVEQEYQEDKLEVEVEVAVEGAAVRPLSPMALELSSLGILVIQVVQELPEAPAPVM